MIGMGCSVFFRSAKVQTFCRNCNSKENALSYRLLTPTAKHVSVDAVRAQGRAACAPGNLLYRRRCHCCIIRYVQVESLSRFRRLLIFQVFLLAKIPALVFYRIKFHGFFIILVERVRVNTISIYQMRETHHLKRAVKQLVRACIYTE